MDPVFGPAVLTAILPLGTELMETLSPSTNPTHASIFKDFFNCLVSLAGTNKDDGHLQLVRAVVEWAPKCVQATLMTPTEGEPSEGPGGDRRVGVTISESLGPINSLFQYLCQLTTAIQFSSNMVQYTEKRGVAAEDDSLFDEDEGGEEVGLGGTGGGADEEDSTAEDAVSGWGKIWGPSIICSSSFFSLPLPPPSLQDAEDLNSKLCTFTLTQREFANQHWYHCHTCHLVNGSGVCTICAKVCHKVRGEEEGRGEARGE